MNYTIENEKMRVDICDVGAELASIFNKANSTEYLWQGDEKYWSGRAYNLFPICGRLYEGKYTYRGNEYTMGLHGFVRHSTLTVVEHEAEKITFELRPDDEIRAMYPFEFIYKVTYIISDTKLKTIVTVENTDEKKMYFAIGGHPGFNVPLHKDEKFEDYYLEFDCVKAAERILCSPLFFTGKTEPYYLKDGKIIELSHSLFENDATFLTNMCKKITLKSKASDSFVRMEFPDFRNVGFWHAPKSDAPYVCIEPWTSLPSNDGEIDDLETKNQMTALAPGESYSIDFDIIIG